MNIDLTDPKYVKELKQNAHILFDSPSGKEFMAFLEKACGFYTGVFDPVNRDMILVNEGKRQVVSTIKSILTMTEEQIISWVKQKEGV